MSLRCADRGLRSCTRDSLEHQVQSQVRPFPDLEAGGGEPSQPSRPRAVEGNSDAGSGRKREVPDAGGSALTGSAGSGNAPARTGGSGLRRASGTVSPRFQEAKEAGT